MKLKKKIKKFHHLVLLETYNGLENQEKLKEIHKTINHQYSMKTQIKNKYITKVNNLRDSSSSN